VRQQRHRPQTIAACSTSLSISADELIDPNPFDGAAEAGPTRVAPATNAVAAASENINFRIALSFRSRRVIPMRIMPTRSFDIFNREIFVIRVIAGL
jgi:hypothetical protein